MTPPPGPHAPFGYRRADGRLEPDEGEQKTIDVILNARRLGKTTVEILAWLRVTKRPARGRGWHRSLLYTVLRRHRHDPRWSPPVRSATRAAARRRASASGGGGHV